MPSKPTKIPFIPYLEFFSDVSGNNMIVRAHHEDHAEVTTFSKMKRRKYESWSVSVTKIQGRPEFKHPYGKKHTTPAKVQKMLESISLVEWFLTGKNPLWRMQIAKLKPYRKIKGAYIYKPEN